MRSNGMSGECVAAAALSLACLSAAPARADVLEIGSDGAVRTRIGTGAVAWLDATADDAPVVPGAASSPAAPGAPAPFAAALGNAATAARISPALLEALVWQESRWRPDAVSPKGARGLAQLMPATARELGADADDPAANLAAGARYLRRQLDRFDGDVERALSAYNAGPERVARAGGIPRIAETRAYVAAVLGRLSSNIVNGE